MKERDTERDFQAGPTVLNPNPPTRHYNLKHSFTNYMSASLSLPNLVCVGRRRQVVGRRRRRLKPKLKREAERDRRKFVVAPLGSMRWISSWVHKEAEGEREEPYMYLYTSGTCVCPICRWQFFFSSSQQLLLFGSCVISFVSVCNRPNAMGNFRPKRAFSSHTHTCLLACLLACFTHRLKQQFLFLCKQAATGYAAVHNTVRICKH